MKTKTKQTTRTGTESEKWTSQGGISVGSGKGGIGGKRYREEAGQLLGIKQTGRDKWYRKQRTQRIYTTHGHELRGGNGGGLGGQGGGGIKGKNWKNCNSIINKKYLKNKKLYI